MFIDQFLTKLSNREKKVFYVSLFCVLVVLLDLLCLRPFLNELDKVNREITNQKIRIENDLQILARKDTIMRKSNQFSKYITEQIGEEDDINTAFFSSMERIATESNINLIKSNPAETVKDKYFTEYYANLDCAGSIEDMITFMHNVNSTDDLFKVVKFTLTPKRGAENQVNASMTIVKLLVSGDGSEVLSTQ